MTNLYYKLLSGWGGSREGVSVRDAATAKTQLFITGPCRLHVVHVFIHIVKETQRNNERKHDLIALSVIPVQWLSL